MLTKINKYIVFFIYFFITSNLSSEDLLETKEDYRLVISEIVQTLNKNHFKKNIEITHKKVIDNFLINLDKEISIDVIITRLRKKIEKDPKNPKFLQTLRGEGYVLWIE